MRAFVPIAAVACMVVAASTPISAQAPSIPKATFAKSLQVNLKAMKVTPSGLYYRDIVVGKGAVVTKGATASMRYDGRLVDGTGFDARKAGQPPLDFVVGTGMVISGWDEGVAGMRVGGKRQLIIPPALGYGANGIGRIPPNSILVFTVEVVAVH